MQSHVTFSENLRMAFYIQERRAKEQTLFVHHDQTMDYFKGHKAGLPVCLLTDPLTP